MSADNGVYIAKFFDGYRVAHISGFDVCMPESNYPENLKDAVKKIYFGASDVYTNYQDARTEAEDLLKDIIFNLGSCEYGIVDYTFDEYFPKISRDEALRIIEEYEDKLEDDKYNA